MSANLISLFLLLLAGQSALSALVARIDDGPIRLVPLGMNKYNLRLGNQYGSVLEELVQKSSPGIMQVTGRLNQPSFRPAGNLIVSYQQQPQEPQISPFVFLPQTQQRLIGFPRGQPLLIPQLRSPVGQDDMNAMNDMPDMNDMSDMNDDPSYLNNFSLSAQ